MSAVRVVIPQREIVLLSLNHNLNYNKGYFQSNPFGPFWITLVRSLLDYLPPHYNTKQAHKYKHSLIGLSADTCSHSGPIPPANPVRSQPAHTPPAGQTSHVPPHTPTARHRPGSHPAANSLPPPRAGEEVRHGHLRPRPVHDLKIKGLQRELPPGDPRVDVLHAVEPLEGGVVGVEGERAPQQVVAEGADRPPDGEALLLHRAVPTLPV